jgi:acetyltransferase-like isoleucine patch superfamily enzyme
MSAQHSPSWLQRIKSNPKLKKWLIWTISPSRRPRPRFWVRWLVNPFIHKKGSHTVIRRRYSRIDVFPWKRFQVGRETTVEDFTVINNGAGDVIIGDRVRIGIGTVLIGPVQIGDGAGTGQHVFISGFNHGYADGRRNSSGQPLVVKGVIIEEESHIGANSVVLAGVRIGRRSQIGAGSVVTKDIPPFSVAVGNPARVIKRYNEATGQWEKWNGPDSGGEPCTF